MPKVSSRATLDEKLDANAKRIRALRRAADATRAAEAQAEAEPTPKAVTVAHVREP